VGDWLTGIHFIALFDLRSLDLLPHLSLLTVWFDECGLTTVVNVLQVPYLPTAYTRVLLFMKQANKLN